MNKVKILVVEDEILIADNICDTLEDLGYIALEPVMSYSEAIESIETEKPDLAILDIQLAGEKTGIDLARTIRKEYNFPFIFLTSNSDHATLNEAKTVQPYAFLVKPFSLGELFSAIEVALYNFSQQLETLNANKKNNQNTLFIKDKGVYKKVNLNDLVYLTNDHVYLELFFSNNKKVVIRGGLNDIILKLNQNFIRVHRGYIVNINYLKEFDNNTLIINNKSIPLGKKYQPNLLKKINFV